MGIKFQSAQKQDCEDIAIWINSVGHGHIEYLLDGLVPERTALQHLTIMLQEDENYSYKNVDLAINDSAIVGLVFSYAAELNAASADVRAHLSKDRIEWMSYFSENFVENSWYINTLGVAKNLRRQGIATRLLEQASRRALKNDYQCLSLHVYENNNAAIEFYESFGFSQEKKVDLTGHPFFQARDLAANILMKCKLSA